MKEEGQYTLEYLNPKKLPKWITVPFNVLFVLVMIIAIVVAIFSCVFLRTPVIGPSMMPTINNELVSPDMETIKDYVLINRTKKGERGDIIVIERNDPYTGSKYIIKRLLALAGDKISIQQVGSSFQVWLIKKDGDGTIEVDTKFCDETSLTSNNYTNRSMLLTYNSFQDLMTKDETKDMFVEVDGVSYMQIPKDSVFYLGDNRAHSEDCSNYGPMSIKKVVGKVELIIPHDQKVFEACFNFFWQEFKNLIKV